MKKIYFIGDSTMQANNIFAYPQFGWGQVINLFLKEGYQAFDFARNGRSTKSFIDEGRFNKVLNLLEKGDYLVCQFGHNDEKEYDSSRYTNKDTTYLENLEFFAKEASKKGAHIVFATSISRRVFKDGICQDTHLGYPQAMVKWCSENDYTCVDLNTLTLNLYNKLGEEETKRFHMIFAPGEYENFPEGKNDTSHLRIDGAVMVAKLFVEALAKTNDPINECFLNLEEKEEYEEKALRD